MDAEHNNGLEESLAECKFRRKKDRGGHKIDTSFRKMRILFGFRCLKQYQSVSNDLRGSFRDT